MTQSDNTTEKLKEFVLETRLQRIESVLQHRTKSLCIVLEHVHNPHNISAVLRSADAFGIQDVHLIGEEFQYSRGISLGAERWLTLQKHLSPLPVLTDLKKNGFKIVILAPEDKNLPGKSLPVFELPFSEKLALVFGNEHRGVSEEVAHAADFRAHIPMFGFVESFNISVAAAICMFCSSITGAIGERTLKHISEEEKAALRQEWLVKSLRNGGNVLKEIEERESED